MTRARNWKSDRMLALKLAMPVAVNAIAFDIWADHAFDYAVCDFFGVDHTKRDYDSLRRVARRMTGAMDALPDWHSMAAQLRSIMESDNETVHSDS